MPGIKEATREEVPPKRGDRSSGQGGGPPLEKVTVNLTKRSVEALDDLVEATGKTKTDAINKALQVYAFIQRHLDAGGALYLREAGSDQAERLQIF
jgi:hypothetical protein